MEKIVAKGIFKYIGWEKRIEVTTAKLVIFRHWRLTLIYLGCFFCLLSKGGPRRTLSLHVQYSSQTIAAQLIFLYVGENLF